MTLFQKPLTRRKALKIFSAVYQIFQKETIKVIMKQGKFYEVPS